MFLILSALCVAASLLVFLVVPEKPLPGRGETLRAQIAESSGASPRLWW